MHGLRRKQKALAMLERLPYFRLHSADYLLDTLNMAPEDHGIYCLLMFNYYWNGYLPAQPDELRHLASVRTEAHQAALDRVLKRFFKVTEEGRIVHHRIERELEKMRAFFDRQHAAAKASVASRKGELNDKAHAEIPIEPKRVNGHAFDLSELPEEWRVFAKTERPDLDPDRTFAMFSDHWAANKNQRTGKKSDWLAAWRNWVRKEKSVLSSGKMNMHGTLGGNFGRCKYCDKPATRKTNDIPHCETPRHLDFAIGRQ